MGVHRCRNHKFLTAQGEVLLVRTQQMRGLVCAIMGTHGSHADKAARRRGIAWRLCKPYLVFKSQTCWWKARMQTCLVRTHLDDQAFGAGPPACAHLSAAHATTAAKQVRFEWICLRFVLSTAHPGSLGSCIKHLIRTHHPCWQHRCHNMLNMDTTAGLSHS